MSRTRFRQLNHRHGMRMKKKAGKGKRNRTNSNNSTLSQHKKVGKVLLPPMLHMLPQQKMFFSSWVNNRLPEVLWACLAASVLPRPDLLKVFLSIAEKLGKSARARVNSHDIDLTHSALASFAGGIEEICSALLDHPDGRRALRPLLVFESLPNRERWASILKDEPTPEDVNVLAEAVSMCLDHQSQQSTDVRWLILMFKIASDRAQFPGEMIDNLLSYVALTPEAEEMRAIRPSIRAAEMAFRMMSPGSEEVESVWCGSFWTEAYERTECIPYLEKDDIGSDEPIDEDAIQKNWFDKQYELVERFLHLQVTTAVDARFDAVFGIGLFSGNVLLEIIRGENRTGISGRLLLRTLVECRITLSYLITRDAADLWLRFRRFGTGQAKLALLKFDDSMAPPGFLSERALTIIANEDASEEIAPVELGPWCDADLRKMAELSGVKSEYDDFYGWSSAFVHGNWSAIRDASLTVCVNPLHRLHRVPRGVQRNLESVLLDAIGLYDRIFADINKVYPSAST